MSAAGAKRDGTLPTVGFIGLGRMGAPMAESIAAAGYPLAVWNRNPDKARTLADRTGCRALASPVEVALSSDVVITMLADGKALEDVYFGDPAFAQSLAGGVAIDMSTIGPRCARSACARLAESGVRFVEAPVSGSTAAARAATLTIMVGATDSDFAAAATLLSKMGDPVLHLGEIGSASLMKLAVNTLIYGINQCLSEALVLCEQGGVEPELAYEVILASAAAAPVVRYRRDAFLRPAQTPTSFALALEEKDLALTLAIAEELGTSMPQAALNREIVTEAIASGRGDQDIAAIALHLRDRLRTERHRADATSEDPQVQALPRGRARRPHADG